MDTALGPAPALWNDRTVRRVRFARGWCGRALSHRAGVRARVRDEGETRLASRPAMGTDVLRVTNLAGGVRNRLLSIVAYVVAGKNVTVLMATGSGKSLCFQLPALCSPGVTIVIDSGRWQTIHVIACSRHRVRGSPLLRPSRL
jgi:hypothetical protein